MFRPLPGRVEELVTRLRSRLLWAYLCYVLYAQLTRVMQNEEGPLMGPFLIVLTRNWPNARSEEFRNFACAIFFISVLPKFDDY